MTATFTLRPAGPEDASFLAEMLAVAADWRPGVRPRPVDAIMGEARLARYIRGWPRAGDYGVLAERRAPLGAAWWRFLGRDDPGYGFVDDAIPEITVGVLQAFRRQGIGRAMLDALVAEATRRSLAGLCLSVEPDNYALGLYQSAGFRVHSRPGGAVTMLLALGPGP